MVTGLNIIGSNKALQDHLIKRIVAYIIDVILVGIIWFVLFFLLLATVLATGGFAGLFLGPGTFLIGIIGLLYFILQEGFGGATVGKRVMKLQVVGTTGPMDLAKATIRNISKFYWLALLLDWIIGIATEGDPRQKLTDRWAGTTVVRTDQQAYMEEQFRQMATPPPHPATPQGYGPPMRGSHPTPPSPPPAHESSPQAPAHVASASGGTTPTATWSGTPPTPPPSTGPGPAGGAWPQHQWNEQGQLVQPRFCSNCGGSLVPRGDGRNICTRCGTVY